MTTDFRAAARAAAGKGDYMKKLFSIIAAVGVAVCLGITAFADVGYTAIYDNGGFFTDSEYGKILDKADEISEDTGWCIMIITEEGNYSESEARSELKNWYNDDFGSSQKGAAIIMTSETRGGTGNNDYAIVIETFGGASISKTRTYDRVEDFFLDYDEYGAANAFLSACSGADSGSSDGKTSPLVIGIVIVLVVGAFIISAVKRKALRSVGIYDSGSYSRNRNRNSGSSNRTSSRSRRGRR
jgi:hypothetical protein